VTTTRPASEPTQPAPALPAPLPLDVELYRAVERALAKRDADAADRALARLVTEVPTSALVDQAHYERARIAYARRAWGAARRHLDALAAVPRTPLAEAGRYLGCRIAVEAKDGDAPRCLRDYRASYPHGPHDQDVLGLLAQLAFADGGCRAAQPAIDELAHRHATSALAKAWRARCAP